MLIMTMMVFVSSRRRLRRTRAGPVSNHRSRKITLIPAVRRGKLTGVSAGLAFRFHRGIRGRWPRAAAWISFTATQTTCTLLVVIVVIIYAIHRQKAGRVRGRRNRSHVVAVRAHTLRARTAVPLRIRRTRCPSGRIGISMGPALMLGRSMSGTTWSFP